jgi:multidrug efflux pump subunit AcrB
VQLQAEAPYRSQPEDIGRIHVRSSSGAMIPLASMIQVQRVTGAGLVERFNGFPSARVIGSAAPGYSSGEALTAVEATAADVLPPDYAVAWGGVSFQERQAGGTGMLVFGFALVIVFLVLAAQYERWSLPVSVLLAVPFGLFGAMLAVWLRGLSNDVYLQISLLTLLGLSAKNAILIVEFAAETAARGVEPARAALEGARLRFRPVVMTSLAFIFGVLPLAVASGAGAGSRHSIGTGVVGGMLAATVIAILFVPLFYKLMAGKPGDERRTAPAAELPQTGSEP